ncbi:MAG: hypothetical protein ACE5GJ_08835 [Gemmatimonadota bacterium]
MGNALTERHTMQLLLATLCEHAELRPDGRLDIHGAFYDLAAPGFPAKQDRMVLAMVVEWDPGDEGRYRFRVELMGEGAAKPSVTVEGHTDVSRREADDRPARTYLIMPMEDIIFPQPGMYRMKVEMKGRVAQGPTLHLWETPEADAER